MSPQEKNWIKNFFVNWFDLKAPERKADTFHHTDVRYYHDIDLNNDFHELDISDDQDLLDIMSMTDDEVIDELGYLGYTEVCIKENLTIAKGDNVVSIADVRKRKEEKVCEDKKREEEVFAVKLISMLVSDVIRNESDSLSEGTAYSTEVVNDLLSHKPSEDIYIDQEKEKRRSGLKEIRRKNSSYSLVASVIILCAISVFAMKLAVNEKPDVVMETKSIDDFNSTFTREVNSIAVVEKDTLINKSQDLFSGNKDEMRLVFDIGSDYDVSRNVAMMSHFWDAGISENEYKFNALNVDYSVPEPAYTYTSKFALTEKSIDKVDHNQQSRNSGKLHATNLHKTVLRTDRQVDSGNKIYHEMPTLDYDHTMAFLDKLESGDFKGTDEERIELLKKILEIAKSKSLHETHETCKAPGLYEHYVSDGDSLSRIFNECAYVVNDPNIFKISEVLMPTEVVMVFVDEKRVVTKLEISRDDGVYPVYPISTN